MKNRWMTVILINELSIKLVVPLLSSQVFTFYYFSLVVYMLAFQVIMGITKNIPPPSSFLYLCLQHTLFITRRLSGGHTTSTCSTILSLVDLQHTNNKDYHQMIVFVPYQWVKNEKNVFSQKGAWYYLFFTVKNANVLQIWLLFADNMIRKLKLGLMPIEDNQQNAIILSLKT